MRMEPLRGAVANISVVSFHSVSDMMSDERDAETRRVVFADALLLFADDGLSLAAADDCD